MVRDTNWFALAGEAATTLGRRGKNPVGLLSVIPHTSFHLEGGDSGRLINSVLFPRGAWSVWSVCSVWSVVVSMVSWSAAYRTTTRASADVVRHPLKPTRSNWPTRYLPQ